MVPSIDDLKAMSLEELQSLSETVRQSKLLFFTPMQGSQLEFLKSPARNRMLKGGNQSGKTTAVVVDLLYHLTGFHPFLEMVGAPVPLPPVHWWLVVKSFPKDRDDTIATLDALKEFTPRDQLIDGKWEASWNANSMRLTLVCGSWVQLKSWNQNPNEFESDPLHGVAFDEPSPKWVWDATRLRLVRFEGKRTVAGTVLQDDQHWVATDIIEPFEHGDEDFWVGGLSLMENVHITERERAKVLSEIRDPRERNARIHGELVRRAGPVFEEEWKDYLHLSEREVLPSRNVPMLCGWDVALAHKYPAAVVGQEAGEQLVLYQHGLAMTTLPVFVESFLADREKWYPGMQWVDFADPAAWQPSRLGHVEETAADVFAREFGIHLIAGEVAYKSREMAMRRRLTRLVRSGPALLVNREQRCLNPQTHREENMLHVAFKEGYHYSWSRRKQEHGEVPLKNIYSHVIEAASYIPWGDSWRFIRERGAGLACPDSAPHYRSGEVA